jgi:hypothetical protein
MTQRLGSFRTVLADRNLRRVELAFLGFNMTEFATWIAILVYAFERGGATEMGAVSAILLLPSAVVAPFAAYAGDRFRRDRVLAIDYVVQGLAMSATAATLYADAPAWLVYAAADDRLHQHHLHPPRHRTRCCRAHADTGGPHRRETSSPVWSRAREDAGPDHRGHPAGGPRDPRRSSRSSRSSRCSARCSWRGCAVDVGAVTPDARIDAADVLHETLRGFHTLRRSPEPRLVVLSCPPA